MITTEYSNTNEHLYDDIALWEGTEGKELLSEMPLNGNLSPVILDFGYGFGEYLFAASNAYPKGFIYGIDSNPICVKEVSDKIKARDITNVKLITEHAVDLHTFKDNTVDLVLLYDTLHADFQMKNMLLNEAHRILKPGGCLSILPFHQSNWRNKEEKKIKATPTKIMAEIEEYHFKYNGSCTTKGIHWEKCHTLYYIQKGNITIDMLERIDVMNFLKE